MNQIITAVNNERIKSLRQLNQKKGRREQGLFLADGPHLVEEAVKSGEIIHTLVVEEGKESTYASLIAQAGDCRLLTVTRPVMEALSETRTPQGIMAAVPLRITRWQGGGDARLILILDNLQDPGNMGTIIRTADAAGADGVLISSASVDVHNPKCVRSTMGSIFHLPLWESGDLPGDIRAMTASGWAVMCGHLDGVDFFSRQVEAERQALIIGNEAAGVSDEVTAAASHKMRLAMAGRAESLNAAVAAGIMTYDLARAMGRLQ